MDEKRLQVCGVQSSGIQRRAVRAVRRDMLTACFTLVSCLAYSPTLKKEAIYSSETSADFQWTTQR
jgi:hypothetical protein